MFKHFTTSDLAMIAIALDEEEERNVQQRIWVHDILLKRHIEGEFVTLYKQLSDHEEKFFKYFRMTKIQFNVLLSKIKNTIRKKNTCFRKAISPREKLAVCLR
ncbi:unnamed protein product [Macrosiphum euphorbiae]|nr:unnamed protein product [Macrosiphum euphorbiae]